MNIPLGKRARVYTLYRKTKNQVVSFTTGLVMIASSLAGATPLLLAKTASAAPGIVYTNASFSSLDWTPDRTTPSGGSTIGTNSITLNVDNENASAAPGFYRTEGLQAALPSGIKTIKASLYLDPAWASIPVRAGMWAVTTDGTDTGWPIIEYASNIGGYTGFRVYDTSTGVWYPISSTAVLGSTATVEIALNGATNNYDFYLNNTVVKSYPSDGLNTLKSVIFNSFNSGLSSNENYSAAWSNIAFGNSPMLTACTSVTPIVTTDLSTWSLSESRANGHNEITPAGLHVYTDGSTDTGSNGSGGSWNTDKAAGYRAASFDLANLGQGFGINATGTGLATPALQLTVDLDGNGSPEGNLVAEPASYGVNTLWLSSNWSGIDLSNAPATVNGGGTSEPFARISLPLSGQPRLWRGVQQLY